MQVGGFGTNLTIMNTHVTKLLMRAAVVSAIGMFASYASALNVSSIEAEPADTTGLQLTSDAVITSILNQPATAANSTTSWAFLVNDGTGSMEVYASATSLTGFGFTPVVGEEISATGEFDPYHQIPEFEDLTAISAISTGNSLPSLGISTITQLNVDTLPLSIAGYQETLDNVTISAGSSPLGTFGTGNLTLTVTDGSNNSMTLYYWPTSYSAGYANLDGFNPVAGQKYDITGFDSVYNNTSPEFSPISIVAVPEPATLALAGLGGLSALLLRRRSA